MQVVYIKNDLGRQTKNVIYVSANILSSIGGAIKQLFKHFES